MDLRQLRYFVGVVEAGSFTKAASQLNVAQSALSLHVQQMEESLGAPLLVRERTGVRVTASGANLLVHARGILRQVALAEAELTIKTSSPSGEVIVGIPSGAARLLVSELLATARLEIPGVSIKILEGMTGLLEEWMTAGRFNLAVLYRNAEGLGQSSELAREEFCLVAHPEMPPFADTIKLAELEGFALAVPMRSNNVRKSVADVAALFGCTLDVHFEVDSLSTIIKMVAEKKAYSILTPSAIQNEVRLGHLKSIRIIDPVITRSVVLVTNARDERAPAVIATRSVLVGVVRKLVMNGNWPAILPN